MSVDSANRSFLALAAIGLLLGAFALCGAVGGVLAPLLVADIAYGHAGAALDASLVPLLAFALLLALSLGLGARSLARQALASRRLALRVRARAMPIPAKLSTTAFDFGLSGRVVLVDLPQPFSFVYGVLTPRVVVSRGLLESASRRELGAVLAHEGYHVRNLDPLKTLLMRSLLATLFFLPALRSLHDRYLTGRELAADRRAIEACGRDSLAGALLKAVRGPHWRELDVAAPLAHPCLLDVRVLQMESETQPAPPPLDMPRLTLALLGAGLAPVAFIATVAAFGGSNTAHRVTGSGLAYAVVPGGLVCFAPFAAALFLAYLVVAVRARRPLRTRG